MNKNYLAKVIEGDCLTILPKFKEKSIDMIYADPPYFLSNGGISCKGGEMVSVDKGDWDKIESKEEMHEFNRKWIRECKRVMKDDGTIFISGTFHNIYSVGMVLYEEGFKILNNITWEKTNPPPNLSCRYFTHSTETIIWARKSEKVKHKYNYSLMKSLNNNKQMKDVWRGPCITKNEKKYGYHPTQKPMYLIERMILAASDEGDWILDPFLGSGTTSVVASKLGRNSVGIEMDSDFINIIDNRFKGEKLKCTIQKII